MTDNKDEKNYGEENLLKMLNKIGYSSHDIVNNIQSIDEIVKDREHMHVEKIDMYTYNRLMKIKKDNKVFDKNIIGVSVFILYELLYDKNIKLIDRNS
ncbi:hypothetical protein [Apilactobacillus timberlakei]|uniref:hypothetical protein n=1 Tax=Apilactobacillus timberlakei TaxID=2008380 RepID=UPI001127F488|nr:hypothetical protein [Apilactobacillus timberlakei]TPR16733.1 hypothetical protein DYZ95_07065 [Apilactobacillus timberlakei]TPR21496.1 hypothetical protein DY083_05615 [Apilactobacillus timberlakei]